MVKQISAVFLSILLSFSLASCYRIPVQQGNDLDPNKLPQIHAGMSAAQVEAILGQPLLNNIYADNRLVYIYSLKPQRGKFYLERFIVYFGRNGRVVNTTFSQNFQPGKSKYYQPLSD